METIPAWYGESKDSRKAFEMLQSTKSLPKITLRGNIVKQGYNHSIHGGNDTPRE